ncbi:serine/threonine-protein kinase [Puniceibacterium sp. IMCC21224]|uniref:serine/threonine-protein kinase n=1 Tax=Puniceibacterium sp. IMCC21224 TaxID=1618204 RepID=UPI00064E0C5A|nr:serine/threonine-protein kinase [Puniceibacterium sp. IMCC21224]KMK65251.1 protein kinase family protein [Puniceibacterium sp. IMCC21224]
MKDPKPSDIFRPGQVLNNTYEIRRILGRGGTGEVYLAFNQITERTLAIKALNARFSGNSDYVELMKREEQMRNIIHDSVVRYSECSRTDDGHVFLVMDYVEGVSLSDLMFERRVEDRELLIVAHRVLHGLTATHAQGIVHRDLSPDNIILRGGDADKATIIDFGIAKDTATGARTIVGTSFAGKYEYAAPEQLEGHADFRTDLYALGASLLAVARREVPDVGSNPGAVVRFKRDALDTSGISSPLRDLIDWLTAPDAANRPATAEVALTRLDQWLKPDSHPTTRAPGKGRSGGAFRWVLVLGVVAVVGLGLWASGLVQGLMTPPLPVANPYSLTATFNDGSATLDGNAPNDESAADLRAAFAGATGITPPDGSLTLATGLPSPSWPGDVTALLPLLQPLDRWDLTISGAGARLNGLASDRAGRDSLAKTLTKWQDSAAITLISDLIAGPEQLDPTVLEPVLTDLSSCGPLTLRGTGDPPYALFDTLTLTGDLASAADADALTARLTPGIGDRTLRLATTTLNADLCAIRAVLPPYPPGAVSIWLGRGATGEAALTGVYHTDDNPLVDIQMPADITKAWLWVMVVDNTGKVFHVLPNINQTEHQVDELGTVQNGLRRIRVLWSLDEFAADTKRLAMQVTEGDYGKSEVVALLTRTPLFDMRRPRDESVSSLSEALAETLEGREDQILGVASRIIDARP